MDVGIMTGSEGQRKLTLGNATILAYCLRWPEFRVGCLHSVHRKSGRKATETWQPHSNTLETVSISGIKCTACAAFVF